MQTRKAVITHAVRTPFGALNGSFAKGGVVALGVELFQGLLKRSGMKPAEVERVWLGQARPDPEHPNVAGIVTYRSGIPMEASACTVSQGAASGLQAIMAGARAVLSGEAEVVLAGGLDCPSECIHRSREGEDLSHGPGGLWCALLREPYGVAAEHLAARFKIGPQEMRDYAQESRRRIRTARAAGMLDAQVAQVHIRQGTKVSHTLKSDEYLLREPAMPAGFPFKRKDGLVPGDTVSPLADGGAGVIIMSLDEARRRELKPMAQVGRGFSAGCDPRFAGLAAVRSVQEVCARAGIKPADFDLMELGETFAVDALVAARELELSLERINVLGGSLSLGHAFGATGARMVVSLLHEMVRRDYRKGLAGLATSGGLGMAVSFFRLESPDKDLFALPSREELASDAVPEVR